MVAHIFASLFLGSHSHGFTCLNHAFLPEMDEKAPQASMASWPNSRDCPPVYGEKHFQNVRQLTFGGQNAEAYWNAAGTKIVYQTRQPGWADEQIIEMNVDGTGKRLVSTGKGRCTCSYFTPDENWIYFSSTHELNEGAQAKLDMSKGYLWMVNPQFKIFRAHPDGTGLTKIIDQPGYLAETTIAPNGKFMAITAMVNGSLQICRTDLDGKNMKVLTNAYGYNGGPFVSWDSKQIVYRRQIPTNAQERTEFDALLKENLVRPGKLEIWVMDANGNNHRQITNLKSASFAPFIHPDGQRVIFSSNYGDPKGREFDLWMTRLDGSGLERITKTKEFDGFPMFTRDGKKIVFASNRYGKVRGETNIFVADWVE